MKFSEGTKLAQDPLSGCVVIRDHVQHMWLSPRHLNRGIRTGVKELLDRQIGKYNGSFDGILLAYNNVKMIQRASFLLYDSVDMNFDVHFDVVIFRVYPGTCVKCTVNKVSADHLGCLIHKVMNMSVPVPESTFYPNQVKGQEIICKVTKVEYKKGVLGIYGELTDDSFASIQESLTASEQLSQEGTEMDISQNNNTIYQPSNTTGKKGKKKKRKICEDIEHQEESSFSNTSQNQNDSLFTSSVSLDETSDSQNLDEQMERLKHYGDVKTRKKKKCQGKDIDETESNEEMETVKLLDQEFILKNEKRKKKKKRKKGDDEDVNGNIEDLNDSGINGSVSDGHTEDTLCYDTADGNKKKHKKKKRRRIAND